MANRLLSNSEMVARYRNRSEEKHLEGKLAKITKTLCYSKDSIKDEIQTWRQFVQSTSRNSGWSPKSLRPELGEDVLVPTTTSRDTPSSRAVNKDSNGKFTRPWAYTFNHASHNKVYQELHQAGANSQKSLALRTQTSLDVPQQGKDTGEEQPYPRLAKEVFSATGINKVKNMWGQASKLTIEKTPMPDNVLTAIKDANWTKCENPKTNESFARQVSKAQLLYQAKSAWLPRSTTDAHCATSDNDEGSKCPDVQETPRGKARLVRNVSTVIELKKSIDALVCSECGSNGDETEVGYKLSTAAFSYKGVQRAKSLLSARKIRQDSDEITEISQTDEIQKKTSKCCCKCSNSRRPLSELWTKSGQDSSPVNKGRRRVASTGSESKVTDCTPRTKAHKTFTPPTTARGTRTTLPKVMSKTSEKPEKKNKDRRSNKSNSRDIDAKSKEDVDLKNKDDIGARKKDTIGKHGGSVCVQANYGIFKEKIETKLISVDSMNTDHSRRAETKANFSNGGPKMDAKGVLGDCLETNIPCPPLTSDRVSDSEVLRKEKSHEGEAPIAKVPKGSDSKEGITHKAPLDSSAQANNGMCRHPQSIIDPNADSTTADLKPCDNVDGINTTIGTKSGPTKSISPPDAYSQKDTKQSESNVDLNEAVKTNARSLASGHPNEKGKVNDEDRTNNNIDISTERSPDSKSKEKSEKSDNNQTLASVNSKTSDKLHRTKSSLSEKIYTHNRKLINIHRASSVIKYSNSFIRFELERKQSVKPNHRVAKSDDAFTRIAKNLLHQVQVLRRLKKLQCSKRGTGGIGQPSSSRHASTTFTAEENVFSHRQSVSSVGSFQSKPFADLSCIEESVNYYTESCDAREDRVSDSSHYTVKTRKRSLVWDKAITHVSMLVSNSSCNNAKTSSNHSNNINNDSRNNNNNNNNCDGRYDTVNNSGVDHGKAVTKTCQTNGRRSENIDEINNNSSNSNSNNNNNNNNDDTNNSNNTTTTTTTENKYKVEKYSRGLPPRIGDRQRMSGTYHRGIQLHNYVIPQQRYKSVHRDKAPKQGLSIRWHSAVGAMVNAHPGAGNLASDTAVFSKDARQRALVKMTEENHAKPDEDEVEVISVSLKKRIKHFLESVEPFRLNQPEV